MTVKVDYPNLVLKKVVDRLRIALNEARAINKGQPLGQVPKSSKQQLEEWLAMTEQDHMAELQRVGYEAYIDHAMDMDKLKQRSEQGVKSYYGIEEGL